jgi:hypothetical protein
MKAALAALGILAAVGTAAADPHPMATGANPAPTTDAQVAMKSETLTIDMAVASANVKAVITLENQGEATKLVVGFPCAYGDTAGQIDVPCKVPLKVTLRGKKIKATKKKASKTDGFWQWPMKLAAGEKVELVVSYKTPLYNDRYGVPAAGMGVFTYRLTTGARWAGPIGKLDITVNTLHDALIYISPAGYKREPTTITWSFTDYEPTEEIAIMPVPQVGLMLTEGKTAAESRERVKAGNYKKATVEKVIAMLSEKDSSIRGEWPALIAKFGGIPTPEPDRIDAVIAESTKLLQDMAAAAKE